MIKKNLSKLEAEGQEFAKILRSLEQFFRTVKGQSNYDFLTCSWRFLRSNKLEHLQFKKEKKMLGFKNMQEK